VWLGAPVPDLCSRWSREPRAQNSVTRHTLGGVWQAPMNDTTLGGGVS
jgi:hypothetical protein